MTRFFTLLIMLSFATASSSAAQIKALIEVGLNGSWFRGQSDADFSPIVRLSGGAGLIMDLTRNVQFQPEVLYVVKGSKIEGTPAVYEFPVPVEATVDVTYLEVPLLLAYQFGSTRLRTRVFAGPSLAFKLDAQIRYRAASGGPTQIEEDESVKDRDLGLMFGVGFLTDIGGETLMAGLRTSLGFANARKDNPDREETPPLYATSVAVFAAIIF